jgi:hypothetical protein
MLCLLVAGAAIFALDARLLRRRHDARLSAFDEAHSNHERITGRSRCTRASTPSRCTKRTRCASGRVDTVNVTKTERLRELITVFKAPIFPRFSGRLAEFYIGGLAAGSSLPAANFTMIGVIRAGAIEVPVRYRPDQQPGGRARF